MSEELILGSSSHNMTKDCSSNYEFSTWKLQAQNMLCTQIVFFWHSQQFMYIKCSELAVFMYWTCNSMNKLLSNCGLVDAKIRASEKDLPVLIDKLAEWQIIGAFFSCREHAWMIMLPSSLTWWFRVTTFDPSHNGEKVDLKSDSYFMI